MNFVFSGAEQSKSFNNSGPDFILKPVLEQILHDRETLSCLNCEHIISLHLMCRYLDKETGIANSRMSGIC